MSLLGEKTAFHETQAQLVRVAVRGIEEYGRAFGNLIHDIPYRWSGYASVEAIKRKMEDLDTYRVGQ